MVAVPLVEYAWADMFYGNQKQQENAVGKGHNKEYIHNIITSHFHLNILFIGQIVIKGKIATILIRLLCSKQIVNKGKIN